VTANTNPSPATTVSTDFLNHVNALAGEDLVRCFSCARCTNSCPMAAEMDVPPHAIIRLVILDDRSRVFAARSAWLCAACQTCASRCPNGINMSSVFDALKELAISYQNQTNPERKFHEQFVRQIRLFGRQYELGVTLGMGLSWRTLKRDFPLGITLLRRRRLPLLPGISSSTGRKMVRHLLAQRSPSR